MDSYEIITVHVPSYYTEEEVEEAAYAICKELKLGYLYMKVLYYSASRYTETEPTGDYQIYVRELGRHDRSIIASMIANCVKSFRKL